MSFRAENKMFQALEILSKCFTTVRKANFPNMCCSLAMAVTITKASKYPQAKISYLPTKADNLRMPLVPTQAMISLLCSPIMKVFWGESVDGRVDKGSLDAAIGRFPVETIEEAKHVVDKVIKYATNITDFGQWKNKVVLVAEYYKGDEANAQSHMRHADGYTSIINTHNPCINIDKIYFDNYNAEVTGSKTTYPGAKADLLQKLDEGALIINWTGHGGPEGWALCRHF